MGNKVTMYFWKTHRKRDQGSKAVLHNLEEKR